MKQILTIVLCFFAMAIIAQPINSDEVNYILSIQNTSGEPLKNQAVTKGSCFLCWSVAVEWGKGL